jgi:hypothetical protein
MHALNGNTAPHTPTTILTADQLATIAANRQRQLNRRAVLDVIASNRAIAVAKREAKRIRMSAGLQPPDTWRRPDWRAPTVPLPPSDFVNGPIPEVRYTETLYAY